MKLNLFISLLERRCELIIDLASLKISKSYAQLVENHKNNHKNMMRDLVIYFYG